MLASLQWWVDHVGVPFPTKAGVVAEFEVMDQAHVVRPALALAVALWFRLLDFAAQSSGSIGVFARLLIMFTITCLRFKHAQDVEILAVTDRWIRPRCMGGGKRRE